MSQPNVTATTEVASSNAVFSFVKSIRYLSALCGVTASLMILASVLITCQMIWVRYVMNLSTVWQTEAVTYLMIAATILGLPFVQLHRGHVSVDLLPLILSAGAQKILRVFTLSLTIVIVIVMLFYGYEMFHVALVKNWKSDTVWAVPLWIPYLSMPIGFAVFILQLIADLWVAITGEEDSNTSIENKKED